ncbi:MAG: iron-sulfur cluster assembly scaffold protein [Alphaproteobacteria bacterium]|nr:iron-sulfur cluster assembly scaffold protein [Alphaproteobacteria bacterium]
MSDDLYQAAILDLARQGAAATRLPHADATATVDNPLCGDRTTVDVTLAGGRIANIGYKTRGCALCQAAAALLATTAIGLDAPAIAVGTAAVTASLQDKGPDPMSPWEGFGIFTPVRRHPSRRSCVLLPFEALAKAFTAASAV